MHWLSHHHKVPKGPVKRLSAAELGVNQDNQPKATVVDSSIKQVDYTKEFETWPKGQWSDNQTLEFVWEGFGTMFLGLTIVNKYNNKGIFVKRVDPEGAGGRFGVQAGDYFVGINKRQIPPNLPDGEVAKIFHALPMPITLTFLRLSEETDDGEAEVASSMNTPHFQEGDLVVFYKDSTAYNGSVHAIHGEGKSAVVDVLLPASGSLVQGVPVGRLAFRRDEASPKMLNAIRVQTEQLKKQELTVKVSPTPSPRCDPRSPKPVNMPSPSPRSDPRSPKTPSLLRQPSGTRAIDPQQVKPVRSPNSQSRPSPRKQTSGRLVEHFNPFDDAIPSVPPPQPPAPPMPSATFDPFASPQGVNPQPTPCNTGLGDSLRNRVDAFETATQDAETASNASYDFNNEPPPAPANPFDLFAPSASEPPTTPTLHSAKLQRSLSRSMSNQGLNSPSVKAQSMKSPNSGLHRGFSRSDSKNMFLTAFDQFPATSKVAPPSATKSDPPPSSVSSPRFYIKTNEGKLQRSNSRTMDKSSNTYNPFSP